MPEIGFEQMKELLLLLCCYPFDETKKENLTRLLGNVQNWDKLVELINAHGIIALAAYNIREAGLDKIIPNNAMAFLDNGKMKSMVRNSWMAERWKEVSTILGNAGIEHILLKGMALEYTLYGAKGLRQMNDNDILVKNEDSLRAWYLLQKEGFTHEFKSSLHRKILFDIGNHLPCLYKNGYAIEIHHKLYNIGLTNNKVLSDPFDNAIEIFIGNTKALILPERLQLMHLIDHFKKHALEGECQLRLYTDIVLLDKTCKIEMPDHFILDPSQSNKPEYSKAAYNTTVNAIPKKYRFRFIIGDIFPSLKWMKKRYKCNWFNAFFHYPPRLGKLLRLIKFNY